MRKQCLFDPNHLIDQLSYTKHLLNCQSKLKKDWRKCRYSNSHWHLYKHIDFHEKYECQFNPLYILNPQKFTDEREQQIIKRLSQQQVKSKQSIKSQNILYEMRQNSQLNSIVVQTSMQEPEESINFGEISIIENDKNYIIGNQHGHLTSSIITEERNNSQREILKKGKQLWSEPNFQRFQRQFRQRWLANKSKMNIKQKKEKSFTEQDQDEITIENIHSKYLQIDQD